MPTTITVEDDTLERFNRLKGELEDSQTGSPAHNHDSFLNALLDTWEQTGDGGLGSNYEEIADQIAESVDGGMSFEDTKNACAAALREELPEGAFQ